MRFPDAIYAGVVVPLAIQNFGLMGVTICAYIASLPGAATALTVRHRMMTSPISDQFST